MTSFTSPDLPSQPDRRPGELADKATFRRLSRWKPALPTHSIEAIVEKHGLPSIDEGSATHSNAMNVVYRLDSSEERLFLKIQLRDPGGTLATEKEVFGLIAGHTRLPVPDLVILDEDRDVLPHSFLITSTLSGEGGRDVFERTERSVRQATMAAVGHALASIHSIPVPTHTGIPGQLFFLPHWKTNVVRILEDTRYLREIEILRPGFPALLEELVTDLSIPDLDDERALLWCDPVLHNLMEDVDGNHVTLTGVFDFQKAQVGAGFLTCFTQRAICEDRTPLDSTVTQLWRKPSYEDTRKSAATLRRNQQRSRPSFVSSS